MRKYAVSTKIGKADARVITLNAYHEAGHAVATLLVGFECLGITLHPGRCHFLKTQPSFLKNLSKDEISNWYLEASTIIFNAGLTVESLSLGLTESPHLSLIDSMGNDSDMVQARVHLLGMGKRHQEYRLRIKTYALFQNTQIWAATHAIAQHLLFKEELNQRELLSLWEPFSPKHPDFWLDL